MIKKKGRVKYDNKEKKNQMGGRKVGSNSEGGVVTVETLFERCQGEKESPLNKVAGGGNPSAGSTWGSGGGKEGRCP